jgi:parvulin-like peptidyl-prolyl isomerase
VSIKRFTLAALCLAGAVTLAACGDDAGSSSDVVATVNGTDITSDQVDLQYEILSQNAGEPPEGTTQEEHDQQQLINGLNQLVFAQILLDSAAEMGIEVTDEDVDATRDSLIEQYGSEEELYSTLEEQGMARDEVDRQIRILTTQDAVIADLTEDVTDEEVQTAYDDGASARHILVEDEAAANDALDRLDSGEAFADVAADVSTDEGSAANGGELGFNQPGVFVAEFEDALFGAEEAEVVGPVETQFGFHIIERMEKPALDEVEDQIRSQLEQMRGGEAEQAFSELISEWVQAAEVTIHDSQYGMWDAESGAVVPEQDGADDTETPDETEDSSDTEAPDETEDQGDGADSGDDTSDE